MKRKGYKWSINEEKFIYLYICICTCIIYIHSSAKYQSDWSLSTKVKSIHVLLESYINPTEIYVCMGTKTHKKDVYTRPKIGNNW